MENFKKNNFRNETVDFAPKATNVVNDVVVVEQKSNKFKLGKNGKRVGLAVLIVSGAYAGYKVVKHLYNKFKKGSNDKVEVVEAVEVKDPKAENAK